MHVEIQMALNFLISFLYNKLPRRRVNQFGEELEKALRHKFQGHWYLEKPFKGSAFRCLKTAPPLDPVFEIAAREAGVDLQDIQDNLPAELSIWVDPGEVSYRLGEKVPVKILYSEAADACERRDGRERTFNPEAQCFRPIDSVASQLAGLAVTVSTGGGVAPQTPPAPAAAPAAGTAAAVAPASPGGGGSGGNFKTTSPVGGGNGFLKGPQPPLTFTTAAFAQTKFGSTKLKSTSKRSHRMSPTEFSHYIKQRAMQQQQQQASATAAAMFAAAAAAAASSSNPSGTAQSPRPRSLSPCLDPGFLLVGGGQPFGGSQAKPFDVFSNGYLGDLLKGGGRQQQGPPHQPQHRFSPYLEKSAGDVTPPSSSGGYAVPYPGGQHLLVAN